jgi:putative hemolysin
METTELLTEAVPPALASLAPKAAGYPARPELLPEFEAEAGRYAVRVVRTPAELDAALRLRFEVFNLELAEGLDSSFLTGRDEDEFDATSHHLLVFERASGRAVGTYRLRTAELDVESRGSVEGSEQQPKK